MHSVVPVLLLFVANTITRELFSVFVRLITSVTPFVRYKVSLFNLLCVLYYTVVSRPGFHLALESYEHSRKKKNVGTIHLNENYD